MDHNALLRAAQLARGYEEVSDHSRTEVAALFATNLVMPTTTSLELIREQNESQKENFTFMNGLADLLPRCNKSGNFEADDEDSYRRIRSRAVETGQIAEGFSTHYIVGSKPIKLVRKDKIDFTELLLWPANEGSVCRGMRGGEAKAKPMTVCVPSRHYQEYLESREQGLDMPLSKRILRDVVDKDTGKLRFGRSMDENLILGWWSRNPLRHSERDQQDLGPKIGMATPKKRWGYNSRTFKRGISDEVLAEFDALDGMITLLGEFGKSAEAAKFIRDYVAKKDSPES